MKPFNGQGSLEVYLIENKSEINTLIQIQSGLEKSLLQVKNIVQKVYLWMDVIIYQELRKKRKQGLNDNGHNQFVELAHEFPVQI